MSKTLFTSGPSSKQSLLFDVFPPSGELEMEDFVEELLGRLYVLGRFGEPFNHCTGIQDTLHYPRSE